MVARSGPLAKAACAPYTRSMTKKRLTITIVSAVAVVCIGWTAWWFNASWTVLSGAQAWIEEQRQAGTRIVFGRMTTGGFPLNITLDIDRIAMAAPLGNWRVSADRILASARAWNFDEITFEADGPVEFGLRALPGVDELDGTIHGLKGLYALLRDTDHTRIVLTADAVETSQGPGSGELAIETSFRNGRTDTHEQTIATVRAEVVSLALPGLIAPGLSDQVTAALIDLSVSGPTPSPGDSLQRQLSLWRDAGGIIDVTDAALAWDTLNAQGSGTVTLDPGMRPLAAFSLRLNGLSDTAQRFADAGLIDRQVSEYIRMGNDILSLGTGGGGTVELPATIQYGSVFLGPFEVAEVGPILPGVAPVDDRPVLPGPIEGEVDLPPPPVVSDETLNRLNEVNPDQDQ